MDVEYPVLHKNIDERLDIMIRGGRGETKLFERERSTDPNWNYWNVCASASDQFVEEPPQ